MKKKYNINGNIAPLALSKCKLVNVMLLILQISYRYFSFSIDLCDRPHVIAFVCQS